jgi:hypothetical protein
MFRSPDIEAVAANLRELFQTLAGRHLDTRDRQRSWALVPDALAPVFLFVSVVLTAEGLMAAIGIAALIAASILNVWLSTRQLRPPEDSPP